MPSETAAAKWRRWLKTLRETHPCEFPVRVRRQYLKGENVLGDCLLIDGNKHGKYFRIRICSTLSLQHAWTTLLHEWAHAMTWDQSHHEDHGDAWGQTFAELWREHMGDSDYEDEDAVS